MEDKMQTMHSLVFRLNVYRDAYYNKQKSLVSDKEYDDLYDELVKLEEETGTILSNSPTQTVGYEVKSELSKVVHNHPMLSLDKTKDVADLVSFLGDHWGVLMCKMDGLTISLRYLGGELVSAETRGNGEVGEDVLHTVKAFKNVPLRIPYQDELIVDGEAIITYNIFHRINNGLPENERFKNPRNLASGSVRQLDSKIAANRGLRFIAWKLVKGYEDYNSFEDRLGLMRMLGFEVVPFLWTDDNEEQLNRRIEILRDTAQNIGYPIDGLVLSYDDVAYGESLGATGHHVRSQLAFKFYDEQVDTTLRDIEWTMGKTGVLTPTAIFDSVELNGTTVERASLHNISVMTNLLGEMPYKHQSITVQKANDIIPQIVSGDKFIPYRPQFITIPKSCPYCNHPTAVQDTSDSKVLYCTNPNCGGKLLGKLTHFVSKNAMNIDGLSEMTLAKLIDKGWIKNLIDVYYLYLHEDEMKQMDGFGERSVANLLQSIEDSRNTTLDRFIYSLSIPMIGRTASKTISRHFNGDIREFVSLLYRQMPFNWSSLDGFGNAAHLSMSEALKFRGAEIEALADEMSFTLPEDVTNNINLQGLTFVITGSLNSFPNREAAKEKIESLGGKVASAVSNKTNYLINNDINSKSSKNKKAKELHVQIITENEFLKMIS